MIKQYQSPSRTLSTILGIKLHNEWGLIDHANLQEEILKDANKFSGKSDKVQTLYKFLITSHPIVREITLSKDIDYYHLVLGCISQFNFDDIKYFIEVDANKRCEILNHNTDTLARRLSIVLNPFNRPWNFARNIPIEAHEWLIQRFMHYGSYDFHWILSQSTYNKIVMHLEDRICLGI